MEFVLITLVILTICVFLTFKVINYCGLRLRIEPLVFCAFCALSINFALPSVTLYTSNYHFAFSFGLILFSASLVTIYNERFPSRPPANEASILMDNTLPCLQPALNATGSLFLIPMKIPALSTQRRIYTPIAPTPDNEPALSITAMKQTAHTELTPPTLNGQAASYRLPALITPTIHELVARDMLKKSRPLRIFSLANLRSLDALLEYAYAQKDAVSFDNALFVFQYALDHYRNDDYAPFITIEIGNIFKNTGLYDEAIVIYNKAFYLRAVMASYELKKEFKNMIYYLHILKIILRNHQCLTTPFDQIPSAIMQEIEDEFQLWLSQKYAS